VIPVGGVRTEVEHPPPVAAPEPRDRRVHGRRALVVVGLTAGLAGGLVGGVAGARLDGGSGAGGAAQEPAVRVGTDAPVVNTEPVATVAARSLPSVVMIDVQGAQGSTGSGVIIRSDGYILTNNHVVAAAAAGGQLLVTRYKELAQVPAEIVGRDPTTDLAVIRIHATGAVPQATLGRSGSLQVGAPVIAIGAPLGLAGSVTTGVVSALDRNPTVPGENGTPPSVLVDAIQVDAAINPGNSGGPLLDGGGQVIGINTAIAAVPGAPVSSTGQSGSIGVGFAIPIDYASSVAAEIIRTGRATHPYLGVSTATITPEEARASGTSAGALIREVESRGPAALAGIRPGDVITRIGDEVIADTNGLIAAARLHPVGSRVPVVYERGGRSTTVQVVLTEQRD
jgi:putative serine protease PepD